MQRNVNASFPQPAQRLQAHSTYAWRMRILGVRAVAEQMHTNGASLQDALNVLRVARRL